MPKKHKTAKSADVLNVIIYFEFFKAVLKVSYHPLLKSQTIKYAHNSGGKFTVAYPSDAHAIISNIYIYMPMKIVINYYIIFYEPNP